MHPLERTLLLGVMLVAGVPPAIASPEPAATPGPRWGHTFVFDSARGEVLLFGGAPSRGRYLGDTWTWAGDEWERFEGAGPGPRGFAAAAFDPVSRTVVIHGGRSLDGVTLSDTWAWDGEGWRQLEATADFAADHHEMVSTPRGLLAFGGWNAAERDVLGATWLWRGDRWELVATDGPRRRSAFGMTWDDSLGAVVLHGGLWINGQYADVWTWRPDQAWRQVGGPYDNSSVDHHRIVWDPVRSQAIVFGGKNYRYRPLGRTAALVSGTLEPIADDGPSPRHSVGMTWDPTGERILLYGGKIYRGDEQVAQGDLWSWDGMVWRELGPVSAASGKR